MKKDSMMKTISVVIPAYNEELNIAGVIAGIKESLGNTPQIIVVDSVTGSVPFRYYQDSPVISHFFKLSK